MISVNQSPSISSSQVMRGIADYVTSPMVFMALNNIAMIGTLFTPAVAGVSLLALSDAAREVNDALKGPRAFNDGKQLLDKYEVLKDNEKIKYLFGFAYSVFTTLRLLVKASAIVIGRVALRNISLIRQACEAVSCGADIGLSSHKSNHTVKALEIGRASAKIIQASIVGLAILNVIPLTTVVLLPTTTTITLTTIMLSIVNPKQKTIQSLRQESRQV